MSLTSRHFKVVFLGDSGVGKTSIINQSTGASFGYRMDPTLGIGHHSVNVRIPGEEVLLLVIDTAGQEKFHSITPVYIRDCAVICLVASIIDESSIRNLVQYWPAFLSRICTPPVIVVAVNKIDLVPDIWTEQIEQDEETLKANFDSVYYVSALRNENIQELFEGIASCAIRSDNSQQPLSPSENSKDTHCC
jgi:small GTP-binding protein